MLHHSCEAGLRPLEARFPRAPSERPGATALRPLGTPALLLLRRHADPRLPLALSGSQASTLQAGRPLGLRVQQQPGHAARLYPPYAPIFLAGREPCPPSRPASPVAAASQEASGEALKVHDCPLGPRARGAGHTQKGRPVPSPLAPALGRMAHSCQPLAVHQRGERKPGRPRTGRRRSQTRAAASSASGAAGSRQVPRRGRRVGAGEAPQARRAPSTLDAAAPSPHVPRRRPAPQLPRTAGLSGLHPPGRSRLSVPVPSQPPCVTAHLLRHLRAEAPSVASLSETSRMLMFS